jgi:hypothetical protein
MIKYHSPKLRNTNPHNLITLPFLRQIAPMEMQSLLIPRIDLLVVDFRDVDTEDLELVGEEELGSGETDARGAAGDNGYFPEAGAVDSTARFESVSGVVVGEWHLMFGGICFKEVGRGQLRQQNQVREFSLEEEYGEEWRNIRRVCGKRIPDLTEKETNLYPSNSCSLAP